MPLQGQFKHFPWSDAPEALTRWQKGKQAYPIVDAGMRELWHTGYMHNRVRMIVGSILVKHLLIHWRDGLAGLMTHLSMPARPIMRFHGNGLGAVVPMPPPISGIFNPILQGEKFDPQGEYVRQWVPELRDMPEQYIHKRGGLPTDPEGRWVTLGKTYPEPLIGLKEAVSGL